MRLIVGNKNYSSWSLRPWILMKHKGIAFEEVRLSFNDVNFAAALAKYSPSGQVPVLLDGDLAVWDSLAIMEYLAEKFPEAGVWPKGRAARTYARCICAEMHAGFRAMGASMPVNLEASLPGKGWNLKTQHDIDRITEIFNQALATSDGQFLFGDFSGADAYYTPVAARFWTYGVRLAGAAQAYVERLLATTTVKLLEAEARAERDFVKLVEHYRPNPHENGRP